MKSFMSRKIKPQVLGFDIDDVIGDFWSTAIPIFNNKYGIETTKDEFTTFSSMNDIYGIEYPDFFRTVIEEGVLEAMKPYKGVPEVMNALKNQGHQLILVTSRNYHPNAEGVTRNFLRHYDVPYHKLYIKEDGKTKADYLPREVHSFVDDLPENLTQIAKSGKVRNLALITQPWNQSNKEFDRFSALSAFYKKHFSSVLEKGYEV